MYLYCVHFCSSPPPYTQGAQAWITQFYLQLHQCLPLPCKRSPMAPPQTQVADIAAYYLFIYPQKDERLSRPGWLTYGGRFTHMSGHTSAAGRALSYRESSPVKEQRSTTVPRNQEPTTLTFRPSRLAWFRRDEKKLWRRVTYIIHLPGSHHWTNFHKKIDLETSTGHNHIT